MDHDHDQEHDHHADGSDCHCAPEAGDTAQAIDPVCGMTMDTQGNALTASHRGQTYYFCSGACRESFLANPEAYLK